jgi:hypothetical protein
MPSKRNPENSGLPARWKLNHGAYYYLPPVKQRAQWDGKSWFRLGATLPETYRVWSERVARPCSVATVGALFDRYLLEVVPTPRALSAPGKLLAHKDARMTERVYRRKPERIKPAERPYFL